MTNIIKLAQEFTKYPVGRLLVDGPFSGQLFREKYLEPAMKVRGEFVVDFDGVRGVSSSFLEEAFGGLVRAGFGKAALKEKFDIRARDGSLRMEILDYIDHAESENRADLQLEAPLASTASVWTQASVTACSNDSRGLRGNSVALSP